MPNEKSITDLEKLIKAPGFSDRQKNRLAEEAERILCKKDLYYLATHVLGYKDLYRPYHEPICNSLLAYKAEWQLHLHPRGHFKSTLITIAESIQDILNNPDITILIANAILGNSIAFLRELKSHFIANERFRQLFPEFAVRDAAGEGTTEAFTVPCRTKTWIREATIEVAGIDKAVVSRHYDKIVFDDIVNDKNSSTDEQRQKIFDSYREFLSLLNPPGQVRLVGTRWHYYDLYGNILEEILNARKKGEKESFKIFKTICYADLETKEPLFPTRFTKDYIEHLRQQQGPYIFSCQYLNDPQPDEEKIFSRKDLKLTPKVIIPPNTILHTYVSSDPSVSQGDRSDPCVILTIQANANQEIFITRIIRDWFDPDGFIDSCLNVALQDRPIKFGFEVVSFQKTLKFFLEKERLRRQIPCPIEEIKRSTQISKQERIKRIQPYLKAGKVYLVCDPSNLTTTEQEFLEELDTFPYGRYDDILDALADVIELIKYPGQPAKKVVIFESTNNLPYGTGYGYKARIVDRSQANSYVNNSARIARKRLQRFRGE